MSESMSGFDCYKTWSAVSAHFKRDYDFFKYNGKIRVSETSYNTRKDKYFFEKASRKFKQDEFIGFLVSNLINPSSGQWFGEMLNARHEIVYKKWRKRVEAITYNFKEEISQLYDRNENFNHIFVIEDGKHPLLFRLYQSNKVSLETLVLLDDLVNFTKVWANYDDIILKGIAENIKKYRPFLHHFTNADNKKLKQIVLETYS